RRGSAAQPVRRAPASRSKGTGRLAKPPPRPEASGPGKKKRPASFRTRAFSFFILPGCGDVPAGPVIRLPGSALPFTCLSPPAQPHVLRRRKRNGPYFFSAGAGTSGSVLYLFRSSFGLAASAAARFLSSWSDQSASLVISKRPLNSMLIGNG